MKRTEICSPKWYVLYTNPNGGKKVDLKCKEKGVESFLPLHSVVRQWSDRKKKLEVPLFQNYIFVNTVPARMHEVLQIRGVVRFVSFEGKPATIPDQQILSIKKVLLNAPEVRPERYDPQLGARVRITSGVWTGVEGVVVKKEGSKWLVIQIESLNQAISVRVPANTTISAPETVLGTLPPGSGNVALSA